MKHVSFSVSESKPQPPCCGVQTSSVGVGIGVTVGLAAAAFAIAALITMIALRRWANRSPHLHWADDADIEEPEYVDHAAAAAAAAAAAIKAAHAARATQTGTDGRGGGTARKGAWLQSTHQDQSRTIGTISEELTEISVNLDTRYDDTSHTSVPSATRGRNAWTARIVVPEQAHHTKARSVSLAEMTGGSARAVASDARHAAARGVALAVIQGRGVPVSMVHEALTLRYQAAGAQFPSAMELMRAEQGAASGANNSNELSAEVSAFLDRKGNKAAGADGSGKALRNETVTASGLPPVARQPDHGAGGASGHSAQVAEGQAPHPKGTQQV
jgi:hypothetical protein